MWRGRGKERNGTETERNSSPLCLNKTEEITFLHCTNQRLLSSLFLSVSSPVWFTHFDLSLIHLLR